MNKQFKSSTSLLWKGIAAGAVAALIITALQKRKQLNTEVNEGDMQRKLYRGINRLRRAS